MIFSLKQQQETDALVVQAAAVLRAIRYHDDNCGKGRKNCCVSEIIKKLGDDQSPRQTLQRPPTPFVCDSNSDDDV
jgi:hypothetical protein